MGRLLAALGAVVLFVLSAPNAASGLPARGTQRPNQAEKADAYAEVATCYQARGRLNVLALVDESSSLARTDPGGRRVNALVAMLDELARYGGPGEGRPGGHIDVQLAGFGTDFRPGHWTELNPATRAELEDEARQFAKRNKENDTDFAAALIGAQRELATKGGSSPACRLLVLFTDGVYDLGTTTIERPYAPGVAGSDLKTIVERGRNFLCGQGGLADQLRASGTVLLAIGLVSDRSRDQSFLQSIAERDAGDEHCGTTGSPPGKYLAAEDLTELVRQFDSAIVQAFGGTPGTALVDAGVCAADRPDDARCTRTFTLDQGLREFHLLLNLGAPSVVADLIAPNGQVQRLTPGTATVASAELTVSRLTDLDVVVDGRLAAGSAAWAGQWTVRFVDVTGQNPDAVTHAQITVFGGLVPVTDPAPPSFQAGEHSRFRVRIVDAAGSTRTPADFVRSAEVSATLTDVRGNSTPLPLGVPAADGEYDVDYVVPLDTSSSFLDLKLTLDVVTASRLVLQPRVTTYRVPVRQPSAYPRISPEELQLSAIVGTEGRATGKLRVTAGPGGAGCASFSAAFGEVPAGTGATPARFTAGGTDADVCVHVAPGASRKVSVEVTPDQVRSGPANGQITAILSADGQPKKVTVQIPVKFEMLNVDPGIVWWSFIALVGGGVLLPIVLLLLVSLVTARFVRPSRLRHAERDVVVTQTAVLDAATRQPLRGGPGGLTSSEFEEMAPDVPARNCRRFQHQSLAFRRRIPLLPWLLPYGRVRADDADVLASGGGHALKWGRVGFDLNHTWVLTIPCAGKPGTAEVKGRLHLLVTDVETGEDSGVAEKVRRLLDAVAEDVPARVEEVVDRLNARAPEKSDARHGADEEPVWQPPR